MPVVSKGEFTVSRLDDGVSSHLHVGWLMADGTFTTVYPRENLQTGSNTEFILKNEAGGGSQKSLPFSILSDDIIGKKVILSVEVEGRNMTNRTGTSRIGYELFTPLTDGKTTWLSVWEIINNISNLSAKRIESAIDVPTNLTPNRLLNGKLYIQVNGEYIRAAYPKFEVVEDDGTKSTIYTPAPSEDYANAYPKYRGEYTDFTEADSTNPDDYTWTAYLGQSGQDGNNGADGVGIANTKIDYQLHTSATTPPTGTWVTSPPAVTVGKYLWTRTILEYTDGTKSTPAYSVSGGPGDTGPQGPPTGIVAQDTVPSSPYVGMLWQCTGNIAGYINPATYRWNGSAWEIYQFTAQNIMADTFTGFTFQGVKMIASEFISHQEFERVLQQPPESIIEKHVTDITISEGRLLIETNVDTMHDFSAGLKYTDKVRMETTVDDTLGFIIDGTRLWGQDDTMTYSTLIQNSEFIALLPNSRDAMSEKDMVTNNNWRNVVATKHCGKQLWEGGSFMNANQTVTPATKMSDCLNGWLLQWQRYNPGVGLNHSRYFYQTISKSHPSGRGITLYISAPEGTTNNGGVPAATKYIYVTDTTITGYDANSVSPGNNWALSGVFGW